MKKILPIILTVFLFLFLSACDSTPSNIGDGASNTTPSDSQSTSYLLKTYSLTDEYGNAGTYTEINSLYSVGEIVELEATVKSGYNFVGWFIDDICVNEELKYAFTVRSSDIEIEARYSYYTLTTFSYSDEYEKAGTYTKLENKKISIGEQVSLEATVNTGYNFEGWFINDICISKDWTYSFIMKEENIDIEARYSFYTLTAKGYLRRWGNWYDLEKNHGTCTSFDEKKISVGEDVTLQATVCDGYTFEGWYIGEVCVSTEMEYIHTMSEENAEIVAFYTFYTIDTNAFCLIGEPSWDWMSYFSSDFEPIMGTYTKLDEEKITVGETVTLIATVKAGYKFVGWKHGNVIISEDLTYTFVMDNNDDSYDAVFTKN